VPPAGVCVTKWDIRRSKQHKYNNLHNKDVQDLQTAPHIIRVIQRVSRKRALWVVRWCWTPTGGEKMQNVRGFSVANYRENTTETSRHILEDNIKTHLKEI
jgi:hypothetical protein